MWECPNCETANEDMALECVVCGFEKSKLKSPTKPKSSSKYSFIWAHCPDCGTKYYKEYSGYCHICGKKRR